MDPDRSDDGLTDLNKSVGLIDKQHIKQLIAGATSDCSADHPTGGILEFVPIKDFSDAVLRVVQMIRKRFLNDIWIDLTLRPTELT